MPFGPELVVSILFSVVDTVKKTIGASVQNKAGFTNILVPNLFVYHKHGGSFEQTEKQKLVGQI